MNFKELDLEVRGPVAVVTMNKPDKLNSFSIQMAKEFIQVLYECEFQEAVSSIVLTGSGRAFCAGGDIKQMADYPEERKAVFFKEITTELNNVIKAIRRIPKPVIAAVNGVASGAGFSLALACDMIIASNKARFNLSHVHVGLHPDGGATYFLPRVIGVYKTREMVFTGRFLSASEGADLNIVNRIVPADKLMDEAMGIAEKLATGATFAIGLAKGTIDRGLIESLEGQLENERQAIALTGMTRDLKEGVNAFLEKRKPLFKGY